MKKNVYKLSVNFQVKGNEYFELIVPHESIEQLQMCEHLTGLYHMQDGKEISILNQYDCIEGELDSLIEKLNLALDGQLSIDNQLIPNIGYQRNQWLYKLKKGKSDWRGAIYLCFSTSHKIETFIYAKDGVIYFEIIPIYPWLFGAEPKNLKKISFKQFLKNYKPYVRTILPRERAEEWLDIAQNLRNIIERNYQNKIANLPQE